jgi:hypothetical protein
MENKNNFWNRVSNGMTAEMTDAEFTAKVVANVREIRLADFNGDAKRASKAANWLLSYDEDFWGNAYHEFSEKFGCAPKI